MGRVRRKGRAETKDCCSIKMKDVKGNEIWLDFLRGLFSPRAIKQWIVSLQWISRQPRPLFILVARLTVFATIHLHELP
jgi:hypothetical protein